MEEVLPSDAAVAAASPRATHTGNGVAGALYQLLQAALSYGDTMREVRPKRERVAYLEQELELQIKVLARINEDTVALNAELQRYHDLHTDAIAEKQILKEMLEQAEGRVVKDCDYNFDSDIPRQNSRTFNLPNRKFQFLLSARFPQETSQRLMKRFGERGQWAQQLDSLLARAELIPGDCLLAAAFLSYCGPFPRPLRTRLLHGDWLGDILRRDIPHSCPFDVKTLLGDERQINWYAKSFRFSLAIVIAPPPSTAPPFPQRDS